MKKFSFLLLIIVLFNTIYGQQTSIKWLSFDTVKNIFPKKPKPVLIFIECDTSKISKKFIDSTFSNPEVANYINVLFYPIKLKATDTESITFFNGNTFKKEPNKPFHSLVYFLLGNKIQFPAIIVYDRQARGRVFYGYRDRDHIFPILVYYAESAYLSTDYPTYEKYFLKAYPPGKKQIITRLNVRWLTMSEAIEKMKEKPKKLFIDLYDNYNTSQTIMRTQTYNNPIIARYLNSHFYPVTIYVRNDEHFTINGVEYKKSDKYPFNTFAIAVLNGKMRFPAFVIMDENFKLLDKEQVFMTPETIEPILHYFGDNAYKEMSFKEFLKNFKSSFKKDKKNNNDKKM